MGQKKVILPVEADTKKANAQIKKTKGELDGAKEAAGGVTSQIDKMTGGLLSAARQGVKSLKGLVVGMKTLRGAIISTGVGALVVAFGSLVAAVQRNQQVMDRFKVLTAGIGAVVDVLLDLFADFGEVVFNAFSNPKQAIADLWEAIKKNIMNRIQGVIDAFGALGRMIKAAISLNFDEAKEAAGDFGKAYAQTLTGVTTEQWQQIGKAIKNTTTEFNAAAEAARRLQQAENRLRDQQIKGIVTDAEKRKSIELLRLAAEEEGLTIEEQIELLKQADSVEQSLLADRMSRLKEEERILKGRQAISKNTADDDRELAELQAQILQEESASASGRIRLQRRINSMQKQAAKEREDIAKEELERIEAERERQLELEMMQHENDLMRLRENSDEFFEQQKFIAQRESEMKLMNDELTATERERIELELNDKLNAISKARINIAQREAAAKKAAQMEVADAVAMGVQGIAAAAGENKGIAIAAATIDTFVAANKAVAQLGPIAGPIAATGIVASGIANVRQIASTEVPGGGGSGGGSVPSAPTGFDDVTNQRFDAFQQEGQAASVRDVSEREPVQAFVLEGAVTSSQNNQQRLRNKARI